MRQRMISNPRSAAVVVVLLLVVLCMTWAAHGEWYWIHGHSGRIQAETKIDPNPHGDLACYWHQVESIDSHAQGGSWCSDGSYITAIDLDREGDYSAMDSPVIGAVRCCKMDLPNPTRGWGLDFWLKSNANTWVHFAILTPASKRVRYIGLEFNTSDGGTVTQVHIWNGCTKVKKFIQTWSGNQDVTLDLGSLISFNRGLGISVQVTSHMDNSGHFKFRAVGANFVD